MNNTSGNSLSSHSELTFPDWNKNCARGSKRDFLFIHHYKSLQKMADKFLTKLSQNLLEILNDEEYYDIPGGRRWANENMILAAGWETEERH